MNPLVYIVLPVYNGEKYLLQQLMSIYFQDYENRHLIIINDGSTDSTKSIINEFIKDYGLEKKVTNVYQENRGVNKSVEHGLIIAKELSEQSGNIDSYVTFCDADDLLMMNKLSYQINFMENHKECDLSYHDLILIDENNLVISTSFLRELNKNVLTSVKCDKFYEFAFSNHIASNTPMFRVDKIGLLIPFPEIFPYHDWRTALVFSGNNFNITRLGIALGCYRRCANIKSESKKRYNLGKLFGDFVVGLKGIRDNISSPDKINEIDEYIRYYKDREKWMKNNISKLRQMVYIVFFHPKIIMYKIMSYFNI